MFKPVTSSDEISSPDLSIWVPGSTPTKPSSSSTKALQRLADIDRQILDLHDEHRVLTTPLVIALTGRPERTIDYRLSRLYKQGLVGRTRPYADKGSAPFYWWLSASGARLTNGTSLAPGKRTPNPLFLDHATATVALWAALVADTGVEGAADGDGVTPERLLRGVDLQPVVWLRDETAWEEFEPRGISRWSDTRSGHRKLRPDARAEVRLGDAESVRAFVEIDLGTMDQGRLATKVARFVDYQDSEAWVDRHGHCPALLLLTTSDARVRTFLQRARKPLQLTEAFDRALKDVRSWAQSRQDDGPQYEVAAFWDHLDVKHWEWAVKHQDLIWDTAEWVETLTNFQHRSSEMPEELFAQWKSFHDAQFRRQVQMVLAHREAIARDDPRMRSIVKELGDGFMVSWNSLEIDHPADGIEVCTQERQNYEQRRTKDVQPRIASLTRRERRRGYGQEILDAYDRENLLVCNTCEAVCHRDENRHWCPYCSGRYHPAHEHVPPLSLRVALDALAAKAGLV